MRGANDHRHHRSQSGTLVERVRVVPPNAVVSTNRSICRVRLLAAWTCARSQSAHDLKPMVVVLQQPEQKEPRCSIAWRQGCRALECIGTVWSVIIDLLGPLEGTAALVALGGAAALLMTLGCSAQRWSSDSVRSIRCSRPRFPRWQDATHLPGLREGHHAQHSDGLVDLLIRGLHPHGAVAGKFWTISRWVPVAWTAASSSAHFIANGAAQGRGAARAGRR